MKSRSQSQLNLPPSLLAKRGHDSAAPAKRGQQPELDAPSPDALAAEMFDEALDRAGITTGEVAYILGCSEQHVRKMRNVNERECPSSVQLLKLGPAFLIEWHCAMDRRFGFGRAALGRLLDAAGALALGMVR